MKSGFCTLLVYLLLLVELGTDDSLCIFQPIRHKYMFAFETGGLFLTLETIVDKSSFWLHHMIFPIRWCMPSCHGNVDFLVHVVLKVKKNNLATRLNYLVAAVKLSIVTGQTKSDGKRFYETIESSRTATK